MSQIYLNTGSLSPTILTTLTADDDTVATSAANNINVFGVQTDENNDNGIQTTASGDTLFVQLTNRITGTVQTTGAQTLTIITLPMQIPPSQTGNSTFYIQGNVQAFNAITPAGGGYSFSGAFRTDGVTSFEIGTEFHDQFEETALEASDIFLSASGVGNNIIVQVLGVAGLVINWNALITYRSVG